MPLTSSPPQTALPRRLTFTTDSAQQQYQTAMKSVQQYLRAHMPTDQLEMLGVNDQRARYYYEEIQQYLAHRVSHEKKQQQGKNTSAQKPQSRPQQQRSMQRRESDLLLLQNLDGFLDELDPALFEPAVVSAAATAAVADTTQIPSRMKRSCSYIKEMQQEARMYRNFCQDAPFLVKKHKAEMTVMH